MSFIKIIRFIKNSIIVILIIVFGYFFTALLLSFVKTHPEKLNCPANLGIFITTNGIHLDIIIPVEYLNHGFCKNLDVIPGTKFVAFGWGDRRFYLNTPEWNDLTFPTAFNALFLKSKTAMHVTFYGQKYQGWKTINLCSFQLEKLNVYIEESFQKNDDKTLQKIPVKGYFSNDFFYEAKGSFSVFRTCNIWVNRALKEAGVETSVWSPFDFGVLYHLPD